MVKTAEAYSFTKQWLKFNNTTIFNGFNRILYYDEDVEPIKIPSPSILPNSLHHSEPIIRIIKSYEELKEKGVMIVAVKATSKFFKQQHFHYVLQRRTSEENDFGKMPRHHYIRFSQKNNAFQLVGRNAGFNGYGKWYYLSGSNMGGTKLMDFSMAKKIMESWYPFESTSNDAPINIPELPILRCEEEGKIICLPLSRDEPSIVITGQKRGGKTYLMNRLVGVAHWYGNKKCIVLNDSLKQSHVLSQRWHDGAMEHKELQKLNEFSIPLPVIFVTPEDDSKTNAFMQEFELGFKISLPFMECIKEYTIFFKDSIWDMKGSTKYLKQYKHKFSECKSFEDIEQLLKGMEEEGLIPKESVRMMIAQFHEIFEKNILDISNRIEPNWMVVRKDKDGKIINISEEYPPIIASVFAGLVPVFVTTDLLKKEYFSQYFRYICKQIFNIQTEEGGYFKQNQISIWLFVDEIQMIASKSSRDKDLATDILEILVAQGGPIRIGTIYVPQSYSNLSKSIIQNTMYAFSVVQNEEEAKNVVKDFCTINKKEYKNKLINLKPREIMAFTNLHFVTYDSEGKRREEKGPFRGYSLPPLNFTFIPKKMEEVFEEIVVT